MDKCKCEDKNTDYHYLHCCNKGKEILFAVNGVVIGDRQTPNCVSMSYGEMFDIIQKFLNQCRTNGLETIYGMAYFIRLKEGDGSPYPVEVSCNGRYKQLKPDEVLAVKITPLSNDTL